MYFFVLFHLVHIYYFIVLSCSYILLNIFILFYSLFICLTRLSKALVVHVSCWNEDGDRMLFILSVLKSSSSLIAESEETLVFFIYYVCGILRLDIYIWGGGLNQQPFHHDGYLEILWTGLPGGALFWLDLSQFFLWFLFSSSGRGQVTRYRYHPGSEPQVWPVSSCPELSKERGGCMYLVCSLLYS